MTKRLEDALHELLSSRHKYVVGIDEVGYGSWAGPLVVAGTVFEKSWGHPDVKDSKKYTSSKKGTAEYKRKMVLNTIVMQESTFYTHVMVPVDVVDKKGVYTALLDATHEVAKRCATQYPDSIVVTDGNNDIGWDDKIQLLAIPKADEVVPAVSAASVLAKVTRDDIMVGLHKLYPGYDLARHKGYGTKSHMEALERLGPSAVHRRSFGPIKKLLARKGGA